MINAKVWIISCVKEWMFTTISGDWFTNDELKSANSREIDVFTSNLGINFLKWNVQFDLIRALKWSCELNTFASNDAFIIWWSPNMVDDNIPWINDLKKFVHVQVNSWKPVLWICFGHQIIASAFNWKVENSIIRHIGYDTVNLNWKWSIDKLMSNLWNNIWSMWSHKQVVTNLWEWESLAYDYYWQNQIIKVWNNCWWVQFHPEFTSEFMSFLIKLMKSDLIKEWFDIDSLISQIWEFKNWNPSKDLIRLFLKQYISI